MSVAPPSSTPEVPGSPGRQRLGPWAGRTVAVTGAGGSLGRALLQHLHQRGATTIALSSGSSPATSPGPDQPWRQERWQCGQEADLEPLLRQVDVLVLNHGVNVHGDRSAAAVQHSLEVNALSPWRLLELFAQLPARPEGPREVWLNTSEAEYQPAVSPLYELSKRLAGQLFSLRALDLAGPQLRLRRLVLGPFRSQLNPIGVMGADFVAREILRQVSWNCSLVIVTPNPLTYVAMPLATLGRWLYFSATSRGTAPQATVRNPGP